MQQHVTAPLHAVTNPEEKRRIIGDTFIKIANEAMLDLDLQADKVFLAQGELLIIMESFNFFLISSGTLRPDLLESASNMASGNAHVIKTHHNDTQLVRELRELVSSLTLSLLSHSSSVLWYISGQGSGASG